MPSQATATVLYPRGPAFDLPYYLSTHMPLASRNWTPHGLVHWSVSTFEDAGAPYQVQAVLTFRDMDALRAGMGDKEKAGEIMADIGNFTKAEPVILVGEVVGSS